MNDLTRLQLATLASDGPDVPVYPFHPPEPTFAEHALEPLIDAASVQLQRAAYVRYAPKPVIETG